MLPLPTTTVAVWSRAGGGDPYEPDVPTLAADEIPAGTSTPSGLAAIVGGDAERIEAIYYLPVGTVVDRADQLVDAVTGDRWEVVWVVRRHGLGLDHVQVGARRSSGASSG